MKVMLNTSTFWLLLLTISSVSIVCCKKSDPVAAPDLSAKVIGSYKMSAIKFTPSGTQPAGQAGIVDISRLGSALDRIDFMVRLGQTGPNSTNIVTQNRSISLKESGSGIDLYDGSDKVGTWSADVLTMTGYPFDSMKLDFTATK